MMTVHVSGGTGYLGAALIKLLRQRGYQTRVIARDAVFDASAIARPMRPGDTLVHLTGTRRPAPWKGAQFRAVDLPSLRATADAAVLASARHIVYVSVAHPAPVMKAYIQVRRQAEAYLAERGVPHTILRPWYVLGPGHWWPIALKPLYALAERVPAWREGAVRLGLVTHAEMVTSLAEAVGNPAAASVTLEPRHIRAIGAAGQGSGASALPPRSDVPSIHT